MTDPISQYGRLNSSDSAARGSAEKVSKKAGASSSSASSAGSSERAAPARQEDSVSLSNVTQKVMAEPDFDRAKVESIKQAIAEGQYPLDPRRIAESFMALERMIR